ncbi:hypothetical protein LOAG_02668 [Loa loa]|uniref:Lipocalin n=1 Tax=Loa loa TaxID=7209 RepID=A0A1I7VK84_LOALO|nr:hypothetical protein LOAG_02668 [Loa loa]EFO25816.1 hypothetical protein LOAG_02668 [Loa loa]
MIIIITVTIGSNSSRSSTLIDVVGTILKDDPKNFMYTVDDVQGTMQCCDFTTNSTEWMQNRTIHYYDSIENELKAMVDDQAENIWKTQNDEEKMNSASLSCCWNIKKHCPKERKRLLTSRSYSNDFVKMFTKFDIGWMKQGKRKANVPKYRPLKQPAGKPSFD